MDPHASVAGLRREYLTRPLVEADLDPDPIVQFGAWFDEAVEAGEPEANAMALATADSAGAPAVRIVLLKAIDERGFAFYTNLSSQKGADLAANPSAALAFRWPTVHRQVRITGPVAAIEPAEADAYFASRPRGSQIGAWASPQSRPVADRGALDAAVAEVSARFAGSDVPRPPFWGGFRVVPIRIEFWQGRADRLHDRLEYSRSSPAARWRVSRLAP